MFERARNIAFATALSGVALVTPEASRAYAGGCVQSSEDPYCSPIVLKVERSRFIIEALDFTHEGKADVWVGSKTREYILFGDLTEDGANEGRARVEEYCGPNGDNSLYYPEGQNSQTMIASLSCLQKIP